MEEQFRMANEWLKNGFAVVHYGEWPHREHGYYVGFRVEFGGSKWVDPETDDQARMTWLELSKTVRPKVIKLPTATFRRGE